ncbi:MAG: hypothetical protein J2O47_00735, partial [Acidimicrobiaceae bacterium]|nr:hypothetical protein [Acidimicrobiaceae bacterium]
MTAPDAPPAPTDMRTAGQAVAAPTRSCVFRWVIVVAAFGALHFATLPSIALPPPWQPRALVERLASDGPFLGAVALAHLAVTCVGWYVVVLVTVGVTVRVGGLVLSRGAGGACLLLRLLVHLPIPGTRSLLAWSIGLAALGGPALATNPAFAAAGHASGGVIAPPVMHRLPATPPDRTAPTGPTARTSEPPTHRPLHPPPATLP